MEVSGFEPPTFCLQSRCSPSLSYTPNLKYYKKIIKKFQVFSNISINFAFTSLGSILPSYLFTTSPIK